MRIREGVSTSLVKGRKAELVAKAWFEAQGHTVVDVALENRMHDLEVSGLGRVQVKTCRLTSPGKNRRTSRLQCHLASWNGRRYPEKAFEWLCCVYWMSDGSARIWLVREPLLRVSNKPYLVETYHCAVSKAVLRWSETKDSPLWEVA